jgi:glycosyltransferase involved in cell wall biosynthesis
MDGAIRYVSIAEHSGYGYSAMANVSALAHAGEPICWTPLVFRERGYLLAQAYHELPPVPAEYQPPPVLCGREPEVLSAQVLHTVPEHWPGFRNYGRRNLGYTVWETDALPTHWPPLLNAVDALATPSEFSAAVMRRGGVERPVYVVPHLPRRDWPEGDAESLRAIRRRFGVPDDHFLFYTINTWILRKALWKTLHAFLLAFRATDRVSLFIKTGEIGELDGTEGPHGRVSTRKLLDDILSDYPNPARVVLVTEDLSWDDMGRLHRSGDAYVSLTHSEGFGLGAFDAATTGNPVIITGWGGQCEFLPPDHACLVDYRLEHVRHHLWGCSYQPHQRWAEADIDHAIHWLRRLYEHPDEARLRGRGLAAYVRDRFEPRAIIRRLRQAIHG